MTYFAFSLDERHNLQREALNEERQRLAPDARRIVLIKKRKLLLKDRLQALEMKTATDLHHG